jgi:hypothetical protein
MKEEETMQYLWKSMLLAVLTVVGASLTSEPAHAQSGSRVSANIPFDFSVGNTTLKAGSYKVERLESGVLAFSSEDGMEHKFALTFPGDSDRESQEPYLVFIRYGSEAFLKKVVLSSDEDCDELPESSREREIIKNQAADAELSLLIHPAS